MWARLAGVVLAVSLVAAGAPVRAASPSPAETHDHGSHDHDAGPGADDGLGDHGDTEGLKLVAARGESVVRDAPGCDAGAARRSYDVVALAAEITLNRYLDHDPQGRIYALAGDVDRVRAEVVRNAQARAATGVGDPAVSLGLQGDAIQPLTLRTRPGECLRITLRNDLVDEPASLHLHGAGLTVAGTGAAALATNPDATARPGQTATYEWLVPADQPEGSHYFHSHGDERVQTSHGLFGAVVVEPPGSTWTDPLSGQALATGWAAVVTGADGRSFREFALYYHEIGNENYQLRNRAGELIPLVDPILSSYRPGSRAINYRSEPFMNRLALQQSTGGMSDESLSYSSYTFGDPATPIARTYLGDPVKQRVIHGGSEVFHVHHVHGGAIRWRRQPGTENDATSSGLDKHPPLLPQASERLDSQGLGPSESFDVENECGAGGCQQSPGDYLFHCHVAQHYFAGMWAIWRVYNTAQVVGASTDGLPPLPELPDRRGAMAPAVTSDRLVDSTVDSYGVRTTIGAADLAGWVQRQLPPAGVPRGYDASVLDWQRRGDTYLQEPETDQAWPGYQPRAPGQRPPILFDPRTGKLAYPSMRPHLGKR
ncbi:MAG: multicopper oxidase domain-containing protein, partial [Acidimicrobiales bacterium]